MIRKPTRELINDLKKSDNIQSFLEDNSRELAVLSPCEYLENALREKGISKSHAIKNSGLNDIYAYQIFSGNKNASRDKLLALAIGISLSPQETNEFLRICGKSELYVRDRRDAVIYYSLEKNFNILKLNELLFALSESILE